MTTTIIKHLEVIAIRAQITTNDDDDENKTMITMLFLFVKPIFHKKVDVLPDTFTEWNK